MISKEKKDILVKAIENGMSITSAAILAGIERTTYYKWTSGDEKDMSKDTVKIKRRLEKAVETFKQKHLDNIQKAAIGTDEKPGQWQASSWLLERKFKDEFALKNIQENAGTLDVRVENKVDLSKLTDEELKMQENILKKATTKEE